MTKKTVTVRDQTPPVHDELLITNATIIVGPFKETIRNGAILIRNDSIAAVGNSQDLSSKFPNVPQLDATDSIIMPGLFNAHTHVAMGFFRGLGHGKQNMIESFLFPAEKSLTPELLKPLSYSYILDGLRSGVTSFADHYYFSEGIGRAFETMGVRGWVGETVADLGGAFPGEESWTRAKKLMEHASFNSLVKHVVAPHAADTVSPSLLKQCADYAKSNDLTLHMHLSQTPGELNRVQSRDHVTPVMAAHKARALGPRSLVVHLTSASESDLKIIKDSGATIGYCPASTIIYDRLASIAQFHKLNIPLAIGTDCAASNDSADSLGELKLAGLLARDRSVDQTSITPDHLLAMATTAPTQVLGVASELGTIEAGKRADLVILKTSLSSDPMDNPLANVIYSMGSRMVQHVMIDGKWSLWHGELAQANETDLRFEFNHAVQEIRRRIGAPLTSK